MVMSPVHQVWPKLSCKAQWNGEEDKVDRTRGVKTTSGNGSAWSSPSPRMQWRTEKMEETCREVICGAPTTTAAKVKVGKEGVAEYWEGLFFVLFVCLFVFMSVVVVEDICAKRPRSIFWLSRAIRLVCTGNLWSESMKLFWRPMSLARSTGFPQQLIWMHDWVRKWIGAYTNAPDISWHFVSVAWTDHNRLWLAKIKDEIKSEQQQVACLSVCPFLQPKWERFCLYFSPCLFPSLSASVCPSASLPLFCLLTFNVWT